MAEWSIERYRKEDAEAWNAFVAASRNATFLLNRGYMDYHSDRFADCSWIVCKNGKIAALLPANIDADGILHSHQGLTYGGWILPAGHINGSDVLEFFEAACSVWRDAGIKALDYKPIPYIYASTPSQEDEYALFRLGATLTECAISSAVSLHSLVGFNKLQRRHLAAAGKLGVTVEALDDVEEFVKLLEECLAERHNTRPVHSAAELSLLMARFPDNIKLYGVRFEGALQAAVCVYDTGRVAHAQYIATSARGRQLNLLTPLFHSLITDVCADRNYFDFGISTEQGGRYLNDGLLRQKSSYGATGVCYKRFMLSLGADKLNGAFPK